MPQEPPECSYRLLVPLLVCMGASLTATPAGAVETSPLDVSVKYSVMDGYGRPLRSLDDEDRQRFVNRARCECGTPLGAEFSAVGSVGSTARRILGYVGNWCESREAELGIHGLCGELLEKSAAEFRDGFASMFHPAFLANPLRSDSRAVDSPYTVLAGGCEGEGEGGVWLCDPGNNGLAGCQEEDFVLTPASAPEVRLRYDFEPPAELPWGLTAEPDGNGVWVRWNLPDSRDISGYRVLCETLWGSEPGTRFERPDKLAASDGTTYQTTRSMCGGQIDSWVKIDAGGTAAPYCGDGHLDPGEECDDGDQNSDDGLCGSSCELCVSAPMQALDFSRVCSDFVPADQSSVFIEGLDPDTEYVFALVAHDAAGNARSLGELALAATYEYDGYDEESGTTDFGFFGCRVNGEGSGALGLLGLCSLLALARRRRRQA